MRAHARCAKILADASPGWQVDAGARARRTRAELARLLRASRKAEARYVRELVAILGAIHRGVLEAVRAELQPQHPDQRRDAVKLPPHLEEKVAKRVRTAGGVAFDRMAKDVDESGARTTKLLGISPKAAGLGGVIANARERNLGLLEKAGRAYAAQVRGVLEDPDNEGLRVDELAGLIAERGEVSASRAALIAVDQTLKLNAALSEHRATAAGVEQYTWSTSLDERVRPMHRDLEGQTFRYDDPPETNEDGDVNNPGGDYRCRCVAIPVIGEESDADVGADEDEQQAAE